MIIPFILMLEAICSRAHTQNTVGLFCKGQF